MYVCMCVFGSLVLIFVLNFPRGIFQFTDVSLNFIELKIVLKPMKMVIFLVVVASELFRLAR